MGIGPKISVFHVQPIKRGKQKVSPSSFILSWIEKDFIIIPLVGTPVNYKY